MTAKEKATALHGQGYNCAQSVLMAMGGATGLDEKTASSVACGFGGGAGCRELCGALSGAIMAVGMKYGAENRAQVNAADKEIVTAFRQRDRHGLSREVRRGALRRSEGGKDRLRRCHRVCCRKGGRTAEVRLPETGERT